jgi:hypothetical protein
MLRTILVLLIACAVGTFVYWLTLRLGLGHAPEVPGDVQEWQGTQSGPEPMSSIPVEAYDAPQSPPGGAYLPVTPGRPSWQSRMGGLMGLVIAVILAAGAGAFALYAVGHLIGQLLRSAGG